jgi:hypothetical protein
MRDEMELFEVESLPWQPDEAIQEKVLSRGSDGVTLTRLAWWPAGLDTSQDGVIRHSYHEEVYLLEGYLTDLTLGQTWPRLLHLAPAGDAAWSVPHRRRLRAVGDPHPGRSLTVA